MLADRVEDDVVRLAVPGEVLLRVVDHVVGSERADELEVLGVAHGGDMRAEVLRELHSCGSDRSRGAVDDDAETLPKVGLSQAGQCDARSVADRRSLFEAHAGGSVGERSALPQADELGVCSEAGDAEDTITDLELLDPRARSLDLSGQLHSEDLPLRSPETDEAADEERLRATPAAIGPVDRRRVDLDPDLVVLPSRPLDVFEPQP